MSDHPADVSFRIAWAADARDVARVQVRAWRGAYAKVFPDEVLEALAEHAIAEQWERSLASPPDARHRLLVCRARC
ncbi:hypothetical protein [Micromonospora sp. DT47]|uniref:hypothetical protein n=1 Tax=Micromonospora sp. DT47 TaxID=3393431 RepID=UPI003CE830A6